MAVEQLDISDVTKSIAMCAPQYVPMDKIYCNDGFNIRGEISFASVVELARDIEARGLMDAITIRPLAHPDAKYDFEIVCGHRRFRAHQFLKKDTIPCKVIRLSDMDASRINILENIHREQLNFLQEAVSVKALSDMHHTVPQISGFLQKSTTWVNQRLALMRLPVQAQELAKLGYLKPQHVFAVDKIGTMSGKFKFLRDLKDRSRKISSGELIKGIIEKLQAKKKEKSGTVRAKKEIEEMQDLLHSVFGPSIETRILGWAAGWVSDEELYETVKQVADARGKFFVIPTDGLSAVG